MISGQGRSSTTYLEPLLARSTGRDAYDRAFAAPRGCATSTRTAIDTLNGAHHSWESHAWFTLDTRLTGVPAPLSIVGTTQERKSPNPIANRMRQWCHAAPSGRQAKSRSAMRLLRDALLATMRYYALDPHLFQIPTDADILRWPASKIRAITYTTRDAIFAQILRYEMPEAVETSLSVRPQLALHLGIEKDAQASQPDSEECYIAFTKPRPFWRRVGEPLFCVPIVAVCGASEGLWAASSALPRTFAQCGPARFERVGPGRFVAR